MGKKAFGAGREKRRRALSPILYALLFLAALALLLWGVRDVSDSSGRERLRMAQQAVRRSAVQCYALEGRYPADLQYLAEHYGLILDEDRFVYHYESVGGNLMPQIQVFERN